MGSAVSAAHPRQNKIRVPPPPRYYSWMEAEETRGEKNGGVSKRLYTFPNSGWNNVYIIHNARYDNPFL